MKRLGTLFVSIVLSVVIIYLGAGTVIMQCLRNNTVTIGVQHKCHKTCKNCAKDGKCMKMTVMKLVPTVLNEQIKTCNVSMVSIIPMLCGNSISSISHAILKSDALHIVNIPNAPPRLYLAIIRVLII